MAMTELPTTKGPSSVEKGGRGKRRIPDMGGDPGRKGSPSMGTGGSSQEGGGSCPKPPVMIHGTKPPVMIHGTKPPVMIHGKKPPSGAPSDDPQSGAPSDGPQSGARSEAAQSGAPSDGPQSGARRRVPSPGPPATSGASSEGAQSGARSEGAQSGVGDKGPRTRAESGPCSGSQTFTHSAPRILSSGKLPSILLPQNHVSVSRSKQHGCC
ncbi:circumsporozoite protein-like [Oncorhynchus nerka]|uniref:circumsporozoite protein-like n=1 Tax=Oncorhynchus nerka TaxID=8023 RepID=UPI0031B8352C